MGSVGGLNLIKLDPKFGKSLGLGWFQLTGRAHLVSRVTGHHLIDCGSVIEEPLGGVADGSHHGELVIHLSELGHQLGKINSGDLGLDGLEDASDVIRSIGLGIPQVQVARTALQINHDDALRLAPSRTAFGLGLVGLQLQHRAQGKTEHPGTSDFKHIPSAHGQMSITQIFSQISWYSNHDLTFPFANNVKIQYSLEFID